MIYHHRFRVYAPLARVAAFHNRPNSMAAITPPPIKVYFRNLPPELVEGTEIDFTLRLGLLPIHWLARIEAVSMDSFIDRQIRGPFAHWVHRHRFVPVTDVTTDVIDEITLQLNRRPGWWLVGLGMTIGLPFLFAYRAWKTRQLLKKEESLLCAG